MKFIVHLFLLFVALAFTCCNQNLSEEKSMPADTAFYRLKITMDSSYDFRLLDSIIIMRENFADFYDHWEYDSINDITTQYWDSIPPGNYTFEITTLFRAKQLFHFNLRSDSSYFVTNPFNFESVALIEREELMNADTIEIAYTSDGCWHSYLEKTILIHDKMSNDYFLKTVSGSQRQDIKLINIQAKVPSSIINDLFILQVNSTLPKGEYKKGIWTISTGSMSTTTECISILVNNKLFRYADTFNADWNLYDAFREKYITTEKLNL